MLFIYKIYKIIIFTKILSKRKYPTKFSGIIYKISVLAQVLPFWFLCSVSSPLRLSPSPIQLFYAPCHDQPENENVVKSFQYFTSLNKIKSFCFFVAAMVNMWKRLLQIMFQMFELELGQPVAFSLLFIRLFEMFLNVLQWVRIFMSPVIVIL